MEYSSSIAFSSDIEGSCTDLPRERMLRSSPSPPDITMNDAASPESNKDVSMRDASSAAGDSSTSHALPSTAEFDTVSFQQLMGIANVRLGREVS